MAHENRYSWTESLGSGAMAEVFLGVDHRLGREVAVKKIHSHLLQNTTVRSRFLQEAKTLASLAHKNIVAVHDVVEGEAPYIVMEYVSGVNLETVLGENSVIPNLVLLKLARDILSGLQHAHDKGIIHRDIKPSNIIIRHSGVAVLMDFGIAHVFQGEAFTQTGQFLGTPHYASPEIIQGGSIGPASDIFSFCCLMYRCLSGRVPFTGDSTHEMMLKICGEDPLPVTDFNAKAFYFFQEMIASGLHKNPEKRPDCKSLLEGLDFWLNQFSHDFDSHLTQWLANPQGDTARKEEPILAAALEKLVLEMKKQGNNIRARKYSHEYAKFASLPQTRLTPGDVGEISAAKTLLRTHRFLSRVTWVILLGLILYAVFSLVRPGSKGLRATPRADSTEVLPGESPALVSDSLQQIESGKVSGESPITAPHLLSSPQTMRDSPKLAYLWVKTKPPFTRIEINHRLMGTTPLKKPIVMPAGTHSLTLRKNGWNSVHESLKLKAGDTLSFSRELMLSK